MKKIWFSLIISFLAFAVHAQIQEPVKFKTEWKNVSASEVEVVFTATIDPGWHVYSTDLGDGGPISATFNTDKLVGAELSGKLRPVGKEVASFDKLFEMNVRYFEHTAQFVQKLRLTGGDYQVTGYLEYGACNDENCLPPTQVEFSFSGKADGAAAATPAGDAAAPSATPVDTATAAATIGVIGGADGSTSIQVSDDGWWSPVIDELSALGEPFHRKTCPGSTFSSPVLWAVCWPCSLPACGPSSP